MSLPASAVLENYENVQKQILPDVTVDFRRFDFTTEASPSDPKKSRVKLIDEQGRDYILSDLSKKQIGTIFGFKWDQWFNSDLVDFQRAAEEIRTRAQARADMGEEHNIIRVMKPMTHGESRLCRGIVSGSYVHIDDGDFLSVVANKAEELGLNDLKFTKFRTSAANPLSRYAFTWGDPVEMKSGEYFRGMSIKNSDVGFSSLIIDEYWWRLVCTNGMIAMADQNALYKRRHTGKGLERFDRTFEGLLTKATEDFAKTEMRMRHADTVPITMETAVEGMKRLKVTLSEIEEIQGLLESQVYPMTYMGVVNSLTQTARDHKNPARGSELEKVAGKLILRVN
jgi:hypothetical protein